MRALIYLLFLYSFPLIAASSLPRGATGFEAGVVSLSDGHGGIIGPSWTYNFEYQADEVVGFFGQAGSNRAEDNNKKLKQTAFVGGLQLDLLPLEFRLGIATTVAEVETDSKHTKNNEIGPMAGATVTVPMGNFKIGSTATVIRTTTLHSTALRVMMLLEL
ncbi:MAG: hypothetical protein AB7I27_13455 [Bacteriovoracaceae bacterium]